MVLSTDAPAFAGLSAAPRPIPPQLADRLQRLAVAFPAGRFTTADAAGALRLDHARTAHALDWAARTGWIDMPDAAGWRLHPAACLLEHLALIFEHLPMIADRLPKEHERARVALRSVSLRHNNYVHPSG